MAIQYLCGLAVLSGLLSSSSSTLSRVNSVEDETCLDLLLEIQTANITAQTPPSVVGLWTSQQCEVRPGPEYLLRKYRFYDGGLFELHQYFYSDSHCHSPTYSIEARGQFTLYQDSWVILGATEVDYQLWYVSVMPYTQGVATLFHRKLSNSSCRPEQTWPSYERRDVFHYIDGMDLIDTNYQGDYSDLNVAKTPPAPKLHHADLDCLGALDISLHELQLMRVEERYPGPGHDVINTLFLGDIHTELDQRHTYRPTGYQEPLVSHETAGCKVCRVISKATDFFPPQLQLRQRPVVAGLTGSWVSTACETRTYGVFIVRHLQLSDDKNSFTGYQHHYGDGLCKTALFSIYTRGVYRLQDTPLERIDDAYQVEFKVTEVKLTVKDKRTLRQLNQSRTCGTQRSSWQLGVPQDVTETYGCPVLGVVISPVEKDIVLIDKRLHQTLLYLGQRPSDGGDLATSDRRPTSFQPALVRCSTEDTGPSVADRRLASPRKASSHQEHKSRLTSTTSARSLSTTRILWLLAILTILLF